MTSRLPFALATLSFLLVFATSASAECAWVLWEEAPPQSNNWRLSSQPHFIVFESQAVCKSAAKSLLDARYRFNFDARKEKREELPIPNLVCLPDTVDPRGAKGK